jgi:hypothetical protein
MYSYLLKLNVKVIPASKTTDSMKFYPLSKTGGKV